MAWTQQAESASIHSMEESAGVELSVSAGPLSGGPENGVGPGRTYLASWSKTGVPSLHTGLHACPLAWSIPEQGWDLSRAVCMRCCKKGQAGEGHPGQVSRESGCRQLTSLLSAWECGDGQQPLVSARSQVS